MIQVLDYDPASAALFVQIRERVWPYVSDIDVAILSRAVEFPGDIDSYAAAKTDFILSILVQHRFPADGLATIREVNRRP